MPIYEYYCFECRKRVSVFFRSMAGASDAAARCPHGQEHRLHRLVSRVAMLRSEESRMEDLADSDLMSGLESEDPKALASFMRRMSAESGESLDAEMTEVLDRLESGEDPAEIERSLPDLAGDGGDLGGAMGGLPPLTP